MSTVFVLADRKILDGLFHSNLLGGKIFFNERNEYAFPQPQTCK